MSKSERVALYPGSFDPLTYGHLDLIDRALELFDKVHVAIAKNQDKTALFSTEERLEMARKTLRGKRVIVDAFDGLVVEYARRHKIKTMIRGLRATSDFDYEFQMALTNRGLASNIDTIFLMPSESHFFLSSRLVKEIARLGGSVRKFVPSLIERALQEKLAL